MFRLTIFTLALVFGSLTATRSTAQTANPDSSSAPQKTTLTVAISGLHSDEGQVLVWLWSGPEGFPKHDEKAKLVRINADKAVDRTVTTTFDITPGIYAVTALHDENGNGKMDANILGIPKEGIATSNNAQSHMHAPSFDQTKFQVPASGQKISILFRY